MPILGKKGDGYARWRADLVDYAKRYVGLKEEPPGSNLGPQSGKWAHKIEQWQRWANGLTGYPWCAAYVCGMVQEKYRLVVPEPRRASVGFFADWAARVGAVVTRPMRGDVVCFNFTADNWEDHIGFVDKVIAVRWRGGKFVGTIRTVEGNTAAGNDANGGQVQIRYRSASRCVFVRLNPTKLRPPRV